VERDRTSRADSAHHERITELRKVLEESMRKRLTDQEGELMRLHFVDELDFATIAEQTGRSERDIAYSIQLLIKRLKYHIGKETRSSSMANHQRRRLGTPTGS
jgi:DNA-directed RNA polymerase specialized sigma subunit